MFLTVLAFALSAQISSAPPALDPVGEWGVERRVQACTAKRSFGRDGVSLEYLPSELGLPGGRFVLLTPGKGPTTPQTFESEITGTSGAAIRVEVSAGQSRLPNSRVVSFRSTPEIVALFVGADTLSIPASRDEHVQLRSPELSSAMPGIASCIDEIHDSYGIAKEQIARTGKGPRFDNAVEWFRPESFPPLPAVQGRVTALIAVSVEGKPASCRIVNNTAHDDHGAFMCARLMERGRFAAATDLEGQPIQSWTTMSINF